MGRRIAKGRTAEQFKSEDSAREQHTPTFLCDAAYLNGGESDARNHPGMPYSPGMDYMTEHRHRRRLHRLTIDQGSSTFDKAAGDFDQF